MMEIQNKIKRVQIATNNMTKRKMGKKANGKFTIKTSCQNKKSNSSNNNTWFHFRRVLNYIFGILNKNRNGQTKCEKKIEKKNEKQKL